MIHIRKTISRRAPVAIATLSAMWWFSMTGLVQAADNGTFKGTIAFDGAFKPLDPLVKAGDVAAKDAAVCAAAAVPNEELVVNAANNGIENVFVYLEKAPASYKASDAKSAPLNFDQKGCRFFPHTLLVRVGQKVNVMSDDPIAHNTHTNPIRGTAFNQAIKANERAGVPLTYDKPEKLPCKVVCDLHPWMRAYHLVLDHPFMAVTDKDGKFEIGDLPPGDYEFKIWQEKVGYLEKKYTVKIEAGKTVEADLKFGAKKFAVAAPVAEAAVVAQSR